MITDRPTRIPVPGEDILYPSGPITGLPDHGKYIFGHVSYVLRGRGFEVINPIELGRVEDGEYETYIRRDIREGVAKATALVMLPGWPHSRGAMTELITAANMGYPIGIWVGDPYDDPDEETVLWMSDHRGMRPW